MGKFFKKAVERCLSLIVIGGFTYVSYSCGALLDSKSSWRDMTASNKQVVFLEKGGNVSNQDHIGKGSYLDDKISEGSVEDLETHEGRYYAPLITFDNARTKETVMKYGDRITSGYGWRDDPFDTSSKKKEFHYAIDIASDETALVRAMRRGIVTEVNKDIGLIEYQVSTSEKIRYVHCSKILVRAGDAICAKQAVGYVGSKGRSTGPHLHVEILRKKEDGWIHIDPDIRYDFSSLDLEDILNFED